ncbi:MAG TPA: alpha-ketoglutarate-dependent dioxygenase AlkB [Verrucomicrobiae bacterium]|nr:alpha-ketoglutarate-dependent dioxygenase AlkB [Verrucomicrobiae bacterium]
MQLSFLGGPRVLVDDASGRLVYFPDCIGPELAREWFEELRATIPWRAQRRMMYEREVDVPRLVASYRLDDPALPPVLAEAARIAGPLAGTAFNAAGLNLYRDGRDSVAPHNDHTDEIVPGHPIALLSLGATRRMTIRSKLRPRRTFDLDLEPGSLFVMSYQTQGTYDHAIPKTREPVGERISVALRVRR